MSGFDVLNLIVAVVAVIFSGIAWWQGNRVRVADSFAKLYDELNATSFGVDMDCIGVWVDAVANSAEKGRAILTESEVRRAYRDHLSALSAAGRNTKTDPIESARRSVKAWFIKCLLYREAGDLSREYLSALITADRAALMLYVIAMTREQADFWKGVNHDASSRGSSDEPYFSSLEHHAAQQGVRLMRPNGPPRI